MVLSSLNNVLDLSFECHRWMIIKINNSIILISDSLGKNKQKTNSVALSPQANYTDWATATCWQNLVPTFADRGVSCQCGGSPMVVNLSFLDRSRYFSFK
jgi:hypothetical protein